MRAARGGGRQRTKFHSTTLQRELLEVEGNNDRERNVALNCPHLRSIQDAKKAVRFLFSAAVKSEARATDVTSEGAAGEERAGMLALQVERVTQQSEIQYEKAREWVLTLAQLLCRSSGCSGSSLRPRASTGPRRSSTSRLRRCVVFS